MSNYHHRVKRLENPTQEHKKYDVTALFAWIAEQLGEDPPQGRVMWSDADVKETFAELARIQGV